MIMIRNGMVAQWCHNNGVTVLDFPPYSPDLNPIENIWAYLKYTITSSNPKSADELRQLVVSEWAKILLNAVCVCCEKLIIYTTEITENATTNFFSFKCTCITGFGCGSRRQLLLHNQVHFIQ